MAGPGAAGESRLLHRRAASRATDWYNKSMIDCCGRVVKSAVQQPRNRGSRFALWLAWDRGAYTTAATMAAWSWGAEACGVSPVAVLENSAKVI